MDDANERTRIGTAEAPKHSTGLSSLEKRNPSRMMPAKTQYQINCSGQKRRKEDVNSVRIVLPSKKLLLTNPVANRRPNSSVLPSQSQPHAQIEAGPTIGVAVLVFPGKEWQGCKRDPVLEVSTDRWTGGRINPGGRGGLVAAGASAWWWAVSYLSSSPFFFLPKISRL